MISTVLPDTDLGKATRFLTKASRKCQRLDEVGEKTEIDWHDESSWNERHDDQLDNGMERDCWNLAHVRSLFMQIC